MTDTPTLREQCDEIIAQAIHLTDGALTDIDRRTGLPEWRVLWMEEAAAVRVALLAYLSTAGLRVVPVEATEEMHNAARDWSYAKYGKPIGFDASRGCYDAMLTAAPDLLGEGE